MRGGKIDTHRLFKKVGTHDGKFHADEVMATAILKEIFDVQVTRTRKPEKLKEMDIVYDVGGGEFDHHDVEKQYREDGTPYAACGLIWRAFGKDVIRNMDGSLDQDEVDSVFRYVDQDLIEGIDAVDNGIKTSDVIISTMNISSMISGFNPPWDSHLPEDVAFEEAVEFATTVLENTINQKTSNVSARDIVIEAFEKRTRPEILMLDVFCPWSNTLHRIDEKKEVLFVIYPTKYDYIIQTVRKGGGTLETRKDLPGIWAGKRDKELSEIIGIEDAVFCHPARFIAGARSRESILKMAEMAVSEPGDKMPGRLLIFIKSIFKKYKK